jgi:hypothetical protein
VRLLRGFCCWRKPSKFALQLHWVGSVRRRGCSESRASPATRCIQTLGLLAEAIDLPIELRDGLGPDADSSNLVECFTNASFSRAVLCTHGEVMSRLLRTTAFRVAATQHGTGRPQIARQGHGVAVASDAQGEALRLQAVGPVDLDTAQAVGSPGVELTLFAKVSATPITRSTSPLGDR